MWVWSVTTGMSAEVEAPPLTTRAPEQREDTHTHTHPASHLRPALQRHREPVGQLGSPRSPPPQHPATQMRAQPCIIGFLIYELLILVAL